MTQLTEDVIKEKIVFEGREFLIVDIHDKLPRHRNFPRGSYDIKKPWNGNPAVNGSYIETNRVITILYCHQTGGSVTANGIDAPINTTQFVINDPAWAKKKIKNEYKWVWTGTGRGWPGSCYTYYCPYVPLKYRGQIVIFRCWHNGWITWHSSDNSHSIALALQGYFRSRHMRSFRPRRGCPDGKPSKDQMTALEGFILEYAIDELGIASEDIRGHYDSPHPKFTCPGDDCETFIEGVKHGKGSPKLSEPDFPPLPLLSDYLPLHSWEERQAALVALGNDLGTYGKLKNGVDGSPGYRTRLAIEAMEEIFGIDVDGFWDDTFDFMLKSYLLGMGVEYQEIQSLIP